MAAYRGAVVEDLQLSPALVLPYNTKAIDALQMAFEREFSILPLSEPSTRRLHGWLAVEELKKQVETGKLTGEEALIDVATQTGAVKRFAKNREYQIITPDTPLEQLELFFEQGKSKGVSFALVTDSARKFVLGVVTPEDLEKFVTRRNPKGAP